MPWGAVAGAAISAGAGMIDSKNQQDAANEANRPTRDAQNQLYSRAEEIANTPYTKYDGTRVSDLTGNENQAIDMAHDAGIQNDARGYIDKAGQQADLIAGNDWNSDTASKYMNPYTDKVTDVALRKENQAYTDMDARQRSQAASVGAFGGDRATLLQAQGEGQHLQAVGDITAKGQSDAYDNAQRTWQADNQRRAGAAQAYAAVGGDISRLNSNQITDLLKTGGAQHVVQQLNLDSKYQDYVEQRDWSTKQLQPLLSAVGQGQKSTTEQRGNNATQLVGTAAALAGLFGGGGGGNGLSDSENASINHGYGSLDSLDTGSIDMSQYGGVM